MQPPAFAWTLIGLGVLLVIITGRADQLGSGRYPGFPSASRSKNAA